MDQRTISSVIAGLPVAGAPGGRIRSTNPARLDEVVADVALGDAALLVAAAQAARDAQRAWADVPAPVRGRAIAHIGRLVEANAGPGRPGHPGDRQAVRRGARRGAGDHRHLRLLPGRGPPAVRPDRAERNAGQAAVHVPQPGRRGSGDHRGKLPGRGAVLVHRPRAAVRQRRRVEAGRVLRGLPRTRSTSCSAAAAGCRPAC